MDPQEITASDPQEITGSDPTELSKNSGPRVDPKSSHKQPVTCQVCTAANADGYCKDCSKFLCLTCFQNHTKYGSNATHKLTSLEESEEMMDPQELGSLTGEAKSFPDNKPVPFNPYVDTITPIRTIEGLNEPYGVAISNDGHVVVTEISDNRVTVLDKEGKKIKSFSTSRDIKFSHPTGIVITPDNFILVTDNHKIQKISIDGKLIASLKFPYPDGIAISPTTGLIYVADIVNHCIRVLNPDLSFSFSFGRKGSAKGQFQSPSFITIDNQGIVYVSDQGNYRIQKFTSDGKFLSTFGTGGSGPRQLEDPEGIAIINNLLYVVEGYNHRVSVFSTDGKFIRCFGSCGTNKDQFRNPLGITIDNEERLYICDSYNNRLVVY